jgi:hypothetical protein
VVVPIVDDMLPEGTEDFFVVLSNATGASLADGLGIGSIRSSGPKPGPALKEGVTRR